MPSPLSPSARPSRSLAGRCPGLCSLGGVCRALAFGSASLLHAQAPTPSGPAQQWIVQAALAEQSIIQNDGDFPLRYRTRKIDAKGDMTREVIESREGTVARLIQRDGQPLSAAEDKAEQGRLEDILRSPADFVRHHKKDAAARGYATSLVKLLPTAMRFSYTFGQPQLPATSSPQVVIDFFPDPGFKPPNTLSQILAGVAGRFWIDARTGRLVRVEVRVLRPVDFGWGMLARIHEGGTVTFEQTEVGPGRWAYSHLEEHLLIRELLFKTVPENAVMGASDFHLLPLPVSFQDAVHTLLAMPVPTR